MPAQDAKPTWNHEFGQDETDKLGAELSKSTRRSVWKLVQDCFFLMNVLFCLNGFVKTPNVRIWGRERPMQGRQAFNYRQSLMVWCSISRGKLVGLNFLKTEICTEKTTETGSFTMHFLRFHLYEMTTFFIRMVLQHIIFIAWEDIWTIRDLRTGLAEVTLLSCQLVHLI